MNLISEYCADFLWQRSFPTPFLYSKFCIIDASVGDAVGVLSAIDLDDTTLHYGYEYGFTQFFMINSEVSGYVL